MNTRRLNGDDGASLLIVIVFMTLVSVVTLGLLSYTEVSFKATGGIREERSANYTADAAVDFAIANVMKDPTGELGTPGGPTCAYALNGANDVAATVACEHVGTAGSWNNNRPRNALLTLHTGDDSLVLDGEFPLVVDGPVYSAGQLKTMPANNNILHSSWTVRAVGGCSDASRVLADRGKFCPSEVTPAGTEPPWTSRTLPTNPVAGVSKCENVVIGAGKGKGKKSQSAVDIATFSPGVYAVSPVALVQASLDPKCKNVSLLYFPSGVYHFQTTFETLDYDVVAGDSTGDWLATDGSACSRTAGDGAQFVLSPLARFEISDKDTTITMCPGPSSATQPAISVFGSKALLPAQVGTLGMRTTKKPSVFVYGTLFMPDRAADVHLHNRSQTYFSLGIVTNRFTARVSASLKMTDSPISIPPCTATDMCRSNRRILFRSSILGEERLRTIVEVDDQYGAKPNHAHKLETWSVVR